MGVFCDRLKLSSTAAPTAGLAKTKADIANKNSFLLVLLPCGQWKNF